MKTKASLTEEKAPFKLVMWAPLLKIQAAFTKVN